MPLPHIALTKSQARLLADLVLAPLPLSEDSDSGVPENEVTARPQGSALHVELRHLEFLGLAVREAGVARATDLGTAVHYEAHLDAAHARLGDVVRFADALQTTHPRLGRTLRLLAQGEIPLRTAVAEAGGVKRRG